jgi:hypothetical protein
MPDRDYGGSEDDLWVAGFGGRAPIPLPVRQFQAVAFVNPADGGVGAEVTLELDPGETKVIRLAGPGGRGLTGARVKGPTEESWSAPLAGAEHRVAGIGRGVTRPQTFRHDGEELAAAVAVTPETPSPLTVTLRPWGAVVGRLTGDVPGGLAGVVLYGLPEYAVTDKGQAGWDARPRRRQDQAGGKVTPHRPRYARSASTAGSPQAKPTWPSGRTRYTASFLRPARRAAADQGHSCRGRLAPDANPRRSADAWP